MVLHHCQGKTPPSHMHAHTIPFLLLVASLSCSCVPPFYSHTDLGSLLTLRNKYYPPDFDPRMLARSRDIGSSQRSDKPKGQAKIRAMAPYTMRYSSSPTVLLSAIRNADSRCTTCGNFIYHGTKFNARKETVYEQNYKGIRIYRFYIKCTRCSSEITYAIS